MQLTVIISMIIFTTLTLIVVGIVISRSIKPLHSVRDAIGEFATGNADLTKRISIKSQDEIGSVVENFNKFEEKLQSIVSDIKNSKDDLSAVGNDLNSNMSESSAAISMVVQNIKDIHEQIGFQGDCVNQTVKAVTNVSSNIDSLGRMIESQTNLLAMNAAIEAAHAGEAGKRILCCCR